MTTPGRRGHYADPASPIASTPNRKGVTLSMSSAATSRATMPPPTPSMTSLSPMRVSDKPLQRHEDEAKTGWGGFFSPVLKLLSADEEAAAAAAGAGAGAMPDAGRAGAGVSPQAALRAIPPEEEMSTAYCNSRAVTAASGEASYEDDADYEEFNPYLFIKLLPPYPSVVPRAARVVMPRKMPRAPPVSLVLDLDETLVHCSVDPMPDADVTFPVSFNGANYQVYVRKRPHLDKFLQWIAGKFEVTIFTASQQIYAEKLLNLLDPEGRYISYRLFRDSCLNVDGNYLKDLNVLGRDMSKTVLVDNSPHAFGYQLDNGIPIESWFDDRADTELLKLTRFLETIRQAPDVRPLVREKFRLHRLVHEAR